MRHPELRRTVEEAAAGPAYAGKLRGVAVEGSAESEEQAEREDAKRAFVVPFHVPRRGGLEAFRKVEFAPFVTFRLRTCAEVDPVPVRAPLFFGGLALLQPGAARHSARVEAFFKLLVKKPSGLRRPEVTVLQAHRRPRRGVGARRAHHLLVGPGEHREACLLQIAAGRRRLSRGACWQRPLALSKLGQPFSGLGERRRQPLGRTCVVQRLGHQRRKSFAEVFHGLTAPRRSAARACRRARPVSCTKFRRPVPACARAGRLSLF